MPRDKVGSKREIRPGMWQVRVSRGFREDGLQRTKSRIVRGTEADADAELLRLADEMGRASAVGGRVALDAYFWGRFVPGRERTTTRANVRTYESVYRCHIAPTFGGRDITAIDNVEVQRWVDGLPSQSAPAHARALRAILSQASFDHVIARPPWRATASACPGAAGPRRSPCGARARWRRSRRPASTGRASTRSGS